MAHKKSDDPSPPGTPGNYKIGYKKPPASGQIKPGEVRNPHGKTGKPKELRDPLEIALAQRAMIGGEEGTAELVMYLQQVGKAAKGDTGSFNAIMKVKASRAAAGPAPLTPQEIAAEAADEVQRKEFSVRLSETLDMMGQLKRDGMIEFKDGKTLVAEWLFEAMRMFRESFGESAVPGKDGRWQPKACTEAIVLPRPLDQPVE
jgi:hypothetical protein